MVYDFIISLISVYGSGQECCYDESNNVLNVGLSLGGGFSHRYHRSGVSPYGAPGKVYRQYMNTSLKDKILCCYCYLKSHHCMECHVPKDSTMRAWHLTLSMFYLLEIKVMFAKCNVWTFSFFIWKGTIHVSLRRRYLTMDILLWVSFPRRRPLWRIRKYETLTGVQWIRTSYTRYLPQSGFWQERGYTMTLHACNWGSELLSLLSIRPKSVQCIKKTDVTPPPSPPPPHPPRGGGYFQCMHIGVCAARETPIFSPKFPFRSISFSRMKSGPEHHHCTFFAVPETIVFFLL